MNSEPYSNKFVNYERFDNNSQRRIRARPQWKNSLCSLFSFFSFSL